MFIYNLNIQLSVVKRSRAYTEINVEGAKNYFPPPKSFYGGGGGNLNRKFITFGFLDTLKVLYSPITKDYFISTSDKTSSKKTANKCF